MKKIAYFYPNLTSFVKRDIEILSTKYSVITHDFNLTKKHLVPFQFIKQLLFIIRSFFSVDSVICHFAGYSSLLPALFSKLFRKPCFIIVAGTDAAWFPDLNYGNYGKRLLGWATCTSLKNATLIFPVHESLAYQDYNYYPSGAPAQGFQHFCPQTKSIPFKALYYGYDSSLFKPVKGIERQKNSFLTIGNLSNPYMFKRKGYDLIIELAELRPELNFTLVGWDKKQEITVPKNVTLLPYMSQHEVINCFSKHEYYFQLSIMEGFPNALAESMLCGCVPIGSNVSGIPDIIGDTGYILETHTLADLNQLITEIISKNNLNQLSIKARNRISINFTLERRLQEFENAINLYTK